MATTVTVIGIRELDGKLRELALAVSPEKRITALMQGGLVLEREMKRNVRANHLIDTGNLRASITAEPNGDSQVTVGPRNVRYAAIHEFGGTIKPTSAKYLAVPLTSQARKVGSPRNYPGNLRVAGPQGRMLLVDEDGNAVYALKSSVTIPARPYIRPAMDDHGDDAAEAVAAALLEFIEDAAK